MAADHRSSDPITPVADLTVPADAGAESQLAAHVEATADPRGILRGPLLPAIVRIAAPVLGLEAMHIAYHLVNLIWIGTLSAAASAALTTSLYATWVMTSLLDAIEIGIVAQVSRALGAGDRPRAGRAAAQGMLLALGLGLVFALGMRSLAAPLFRMIGVPAEVEPLAATYLATIFAGAPVFFLMGGFEAIWRSTGDTMTPLKVVGVSTIVNAALDPFLIFGLGPLPALGIRGAALATIVSWAVAFLIFAVLAASSNSRVPLDRRALLHPDPKAIARTLRIGLPRFLIGSLFSSVYLAISSLVARFGTAALAVVGITNRLESMVYVSANSLGAACATMVGQNLGAKQPERARRVVNTAAAVGVGLSIVPTLAMVFVPELCLRPFTHDAGGAGARRPVPAHHRHLPGLHGARAGLQRGLRRRRGHVAADDHRAADRRRPGPALVVRGGQPRTGSRRHRLGALPHLHPARDGDPALVPHRTLATAEPLSYIAADPRGSRMSVAEGGGIPMRARSGAAVVMARARPVLVLPALVLALHLPVTPLAITPPLALAQSGATAPVTADTAGGTPAKATYGELVTQCRKPPPSSGLPTASSPRFARR